MLPHWQLDIHKSTNFTGYTALLGENTDLANRGDLHEAFDIGCDAPAPPVDVSEGSIAGANVWPLEADVPGFRAATLAY